MHKTKQQKGLGRAATVDSVVSVAQISRSFMPNEKSDSSIGEKLRQAREDCRLSIRAVQRVTGIATSSIQSWEGGYGIPNLKKAAALAELYGVTLDWLAGLPAPPEEDKVKPGLLILDAEAVDAILGTTDPGEIAEHCNIPIKLRLFDIAWRVPEGGRVASYQEVTALIAKVQRHISEHAPKLVKEWTRLTEME